MPENKTTFANDGTESFKLKEMADKPVVLNIQQEKADGLTILDTKKVYGSTGNIFTDWFQSINRYFVAHSSVKIEDKSTFFHLLSVMINSGIPMTKSLNSLTQQLDKSPRLKMIVEDLLSAIESGGSLSEAMKKHSDVFNDQETGMVKSGEASGQLARVLENLAKDVEKEYKIRSKVKSAMIYPSVIFTLLLFVLAAMLIFVIPKLTELFASTGAELPLITRIVVGMSDFLINQKILLSVSALGFSLFFMAFKKTKPGLMLIDRIKINIPIFGILFRKSYLARFARSLSNLLDSNVSIVQTLEIVANSIGNTVYQKRLLTSVEDIKQGIPLAENLADSDLFPPMLVNMIEVGEQTAQLGEITAKVADFYEDEVDTAVAGISKIIEPVILVIIGLSVGAIVAAIMLPIMKLTDIAGSI
ncbi:MAG: type II secretion system F family protein [Lutibacter sp.]|nr:type II secretion system F family protein [Lutibacter sp.]